MPTRQKAEMAGWAAGEKQGYQAGLRRAAEIARAHDLNEHTSAILYARNAAIAAAIEAEIKDTSS